MGAPEGHPFFGNQYTSGGYVPGSYTYPAEQPLDDIGGIIGEIVSSGSNRTLTDLKILMARDLRSEDKVRWGVGIGVVLFFSGLAIHKVLRSAKDKQVALQTVELDNVGVCMSCGAPLDDSSYVPESDADGEVAYIQCRRCGEKNFATYHD